MNVLRKLCLGLVSALFIFLLFFLALDYGIVHTAGNPSTAKKLLADSGVYHNLIPSLLTEAEQKSQGNANAISLVDTTVKSAALSIFTPQFMQSSAENVIDGIYHWLDGKVPQPDFKIDLSSKKTVFAGLVAEHAKQVAAGLPACTLAQTRALAAQGSNFNVFNATCLPPGVTPDTVAADAKQQLLSNQNFLKDAVLTADSIKSNSSCPDPQQPCPASKPFFETNNAQKVPKIYQWAKRSPLVLSVLSVLLAVAIVLLSKTWQLGLRHAGIVVLVVGGLMLVFAWSLNHFVAGTLIPKINFGSTNLIVQSDVRSLSTDLVKTLDNNYWFFGGLYAVVGAGAIGAAEVFRRRAQPAPSEKIDLPASAPHQTHKPDQK